MDVKHGEGEGDLVQAHSHVRKRLLSFIHSMALKCAVELGIPDIIHKHPHPVTLSQLVSELQIPPTKTSCVYRLMRFLVHSGFFVVTKVHEHGEEEGYILAPSSRFFCKDYQIPDFAPMVLHTLHPVMMTTWQSLGDWLRGTHPSAFETAHGMNFWEYGSQNPDFFNLFNKGMAVASRTSLDVGELKPVFEGLSSLVDVGGGRGPLARMILEEFPHIKCTVLDLPGVVANLPASSNLEYVGGDMFQSIPSADAILLKSILHNWSDEDCVKILKQCRKAIPSEEEGGKVIIIGMVMNEKKDDADKTEGMLLMDMMMMTVHNGIERNEKELGKLFLDSGFRHYKITPTSGLLSLIEVFP